LSSTPQESAAQVLTALEEDGELWQIYNTM
jgi:hypothetical protein